MEKQQIRQQMLSRRLAMPQEEVFNLATRAMRKALARLRDCEFQSIAGYFPIRNEVDVLPLLEVLHDHHKTCALPIIQERSKCLRFRQWSHEIPLVTGAYGIQEPPTTMPEIIPEVILVPLLAFDSQGHRLGYGGGYYDATLAALRAENPRLLAIGCAYSWQQVKRLPAEPQDQPLDWIVTEKSVRIIV